MIIIHFLLIYCCKYISLYDNIKWNFFSIPYNKVWFLNLISSKHNALFTITYAARLKLIKKRPIIVTSINNVIKSL